MSSLRPDFGITGICPFPIPLVPGRNISSGRCYHLNNPKALVDKIAGVGPPMVAAKVINYVLSVISRAFLCTRTEKAFQRLWSKCLSETLTTLANFRSLLTGKDMNQIAESQANSLDNC